MIALVEGLIYIATAFVVISIVMKLLDMFKGDE
jgi:hypothetical protein